MPATSRAPATGRDRRPRRTVGRVGSAHRDGSSSSIDESLVTGESISVTKGIGDELIGGSVNQSGSLTSEATKIGAQRRADRAQPIRDDASHYSQPAESPSTRLADRPGSHPRWASASLVPRSRSTRETYPTSRAAEGHHGWPRARTVAAA